ncbi:hypothetical protein 1013_scaffold3125_00092 [Bacteriophage sp.]|nr:hypothetical protein 1013_scaffold3125_00092 [Bacteriophage sp.]
MMRKLPLTLWVSASVRCPKVLLLRPLLVTSMRKSVRFLLRPTIP